MNLERIILEQLEEGGGHLVPQGTLFTFVNLVTPLGRRVTLSELEAALKSLESQRHVVSQRHPDRGLMWICTPDGRARLAT